MTSTDIWDDPGLIVNDDYIKFPDVGDKVKGVILSISKHTFDDGKTAAKLVLDVNGEQRTLTAGQIGLKIKLNELRPQVGDTIEIEYERMEKRAGGKTLKHFRVDVTKGTGGADPGAF